MDELNGRMMACQILITGLIARVANDSPDPLRFLTEFRDEIKAVVRGVEKRAKAVHVPGWVGALKYFRAFTQMVVDRQAVAEVAEADRQMAASDTSGLVGPGGQAASRSARVRARESTRGSSTR